MDFQNRHGLQTTGVADPQTIAAMDLDPDTLKDLIEMDAKGVKMEAEVIEVENPALGPGTTVSQAIDNELNRLKIAIQDMLADYVAGLFAFSQHMEFSSAQEAQFNPDTVFKGALKGLADKTLDLLVEEAKVPGLSQLVGAAKGAVEAYYEERDRSEKALAEYEVKEYIIRLAHDIDRPRDLMLNTIERQRAAIKNEFHQQVGDVEAKPDGSLEGKAADFILDLKHRVSAFDEHKPTPADFEREFAENFARAFAGKLIFHLELFTLGSGWAPKSSDSAWTLKTTAPHADRLAESLKGSLGGKKAWQLELSKTIKMGLFVGRDDDGPWAKGEIRLTLTPTSTMFRQ